MSPSKRKRTWAPEPAPPSGGAEQGCIEQTYSDSDDNGEGEASKRPGGRPAPDVDLTLSDSSSDDEGAPAARPVKAARHTNAAASPGALVAAHAKAAIDRAVKVPPLDPSGPARLEASAVHWAGPGLTCLLA